MSKPATARMWDTEDLPLFADCPYGPVPDAPRERVVEHQDTLPGIDLRPQFGEKVEQTRQ